MHLKNYLPEEDVLVVFPTEFDKRHDSESDEIVSPH